VDHYAPLAPLNRSLYFGGRIQLPGLLLSMKGDRVAMNSSVETRYPFLDEEVFRFSPGCTRAGSCARFRDKLILPCWANRPASIPPAAQGDLTVKSPLRQLSSRRHRCAQRFRPAGAE